MAYSDILGIRYSKNLMLLPCSDKTSLILALVGFTKGSAATVKALLELYREERDA